MNQTHTKQQLLLFIMCGRQRRAKPPSLMAIVVIVERRRPLSPANGRRSDVCFVKTCIFLNGQRRLKITLFFDSSFNVSFVVVKLGENTGEKVGHHVKDWYCVCVAMKARNCGSRATDGRASERATTQRNKKTICVDITSSLSLPSFSIG